MQADKKTLISVLMGVYYHKADLTPLERSVRSILAQTYSQFEFLICDGGSSPEALQLLDLLAAEDERICLVRDDKIPTDLAHKLNACLHRAKGKLIARMDDDDVSHSERFERQIEYLETHPRIAFVGCNVNLIADNRVIGTKNFPEYPCVKDFYMTQPFIHPTLLFRREVLERVGGYSEAGHCDHCEDYDLLLRLYATGMQGANIQQALFDYTAPNVKGNRTMIHRWNECVTRYYRFQELGIFWKAALYVIKPVVVGLIPSFLLREFKRS